MDVEQALILIDQSLQPEGLTQSCVRRKNHQSESTVGAAA
jgi:hypothetical protein